MLKSLSKHGLSPDLIEKFDAWLQRDEQQRTMWPGKLELSQTFYDTLTQHAVPLDHRALSALKHSALALDVYTCWPTGCAA